MPACRRGSTRSTAPNRGASSRRWCGCWAISISPRKRCTTRFARRSSSGRAKACPANPRAWLVSAGRFKAIDGIRRRARFDSLDDVAERGRSDRRRARRCATTRASRTIGCGSIFTCCHPALAPDAQVALTLREVCGLTTEEIAQAFLTARADARAAHRARQGEDPRRAHSLPGARRRPSCRERLDSVLRVIYLVFNEGYSASSGDVADAARSVGRGDPARPAARRAAARARGDRAARADAAAGIAARGAHVADRRARPARRPGPLAVEPRRRSTKASALVERALAVAARRPVRAAGGDRRRARRRAERRRDRLGRDRRPLRRAAAHRAVAGRRAEPRRRGRDARRPRRRAALIDAILARGDLADYHLAHAARADLCRRLGRRDAARASYERALALARQGPERRFLERGSPSWTPEARAAAGRLLPVRSRQLSMSKQRAGRSTDRMTNPWHGTRCARPHGSHPMKPDFSHHDADWAGQIAWPLEADPHRDGGASTGHPGRSDPCRAAAEPRIALERGDVVRLRSAFRVERRLGLRRLGRPRHRRPVAIRHRRASDGERGDRRARRWIVLPVRARAEEVVEHSGKYVEFVPPRRLAFTLSTPDHPTATRLDVDIEPRRRGCVLRLLHANVHAEPRNAHPPAVDRDALRARRHASRRRVGSRSTHGAGTRSDGMTSRRIRWTTC